ncbi:hypothetical protein EI94DRAFT_1738516 [Lactarius quietus]|nr:hypothetical protein EI94DRAFT_1738516 [Lactarius quietus]
MILSWASLDRQEDTHPGAVVLSSAISLCHRRYSMLEHALSRSPDLSRHIRSFGIENTSPLAHLGRDAPEGDPLERFHQRVSDFILTYAPNLTQLTIDIDGEFDSVDVSKLTSINLRRQTSSICYYLLALWPSICYLRMDNLYVDLPEEVQHPALLWSHRVSYEASEGFMMWLIATGDEQPLCELHFESQPLSFWSLRMFNCLFSIH